MAVNPKEIQKTVNEEVGKLVAALSEEIAARQEVCIKKAQVIAVKEFQERRANQYQKIILKLMERRKKGSHKLRINVEYSENDRKAFDIWVNPDDTVGIVKAIVEHTGVVPVSGFQNLFYLEKERKDDEVLQDFFEGGELRTVFEYDSY